MTGCLISAPVLPLIGVVVENNSFWHRFPLLLDKDAKFKSHLYGQFLIMSSWIDRLGHYNVTANGNNHNKYLVLEVSLHSFVSSHKYDWNVSLWRSGDTRLSNDTRLTFSKDQKRVLFFEMMDDCNDLFVVANLVHK